MFDKFKVESRETVESIWSDYWQDYCDKSYPDQYPAVMVIHTAFSQNSKDWKTAEFVYLEDFE